MPANHEDVWEWMAEGDRLMAHAYDYLHVGADDPLQLDLAGRHFSRAAQAYLAGGVAYQLGADAPVQSGSVIDDPAALIGRLDGRLRDEADAAAQAAGGPAPLPGEARRAAAERARAFAEDLRERFAHATPDLFTRPTESSVERTAVSVRGR